MITAVIVVHIIVCIALTIIVLLQQGKGADVGAVFGGSSQTVFGAGGASSPLFKLTWTFALLFGLTSLFLAFSSTQRVTGSIFEGRRVPVPVHSPTGAPLNSIPMAPGGSAPASKPLLPAPPK